MKKDIELIQQYLKENNIDGFLVFTNDDHGSEYVVDHYKIRAYLCGFTGSAGTLLITQNDAYLWTDGRYFLQAEAQLKQTNTKLMKMGVEGVPSIVEFIKDMNESPKIMVNYKLATVGFISSLKKKVSSVELIHNDTIIDELWVERPNMVATQAYLISDKNAGESFESKLKRTKDAILSSGAEAGLLTSLDDIAWLFNLRGDDIRCNPVNYAFSVLTKDDTILYINKDKINPKLEKELTSRGITLKGYDEVYEDCKTLKTTLLDTGKTNYALYELLTDKVEVDYFPTTKFKTIKNETEIKNIKKAHVEDAVAMVRFMYWLKMNVGKIDMDELSVEAQLESFRRMGKNFKDLSFDTICGYQSNGAIVHYSATPETNAKIYNEGLLLVDSGAQYTYGTTDITRTFALGKITKEQKRDFTLVLKSHIALASAIFPKGSSGYGLDFIAREPLFKYYKDFNHGTGHGVGYLLNVHEGPQRITMKAESKETLYHFAPGMLESDEPGIYVAGGYGIRHENLVLCVEKEANEFNTFYGFEPVTFVPFDLDAIDTKMLTQEEKNWLNSYHKACYKKVAKYLEPKLQAYLKKVTRSI